MKCNGVFASHLTDVRLASLVSICARLTACSQNVWIVSFQALHSYIYHSNEYLLLLVAICVELFICLFLVRQQFCCAPNDVRLLMSDSFNILHTRTIPFRSLKFTQSGVSLGDFKSPFYFYFLQVESRPKYYGRE